MTRRTERVADRIREVLAEIIRTELRDPRVGFVTVTDVQLSPDLRHARVFVSFIPSSGEPEPSSESDETSTALRALSHAAPFLRRCLAREAGLRRTPELRFEIDKSIAGGFRIEAILEEVAPSSAPADAGATEGRPAEEDTGEGTSE